MPTPGVHITTIRNPSSYTRHQLDRAADVAWHLHRGKLILCEPVLHADCREWMNDHGVCGLCCRRADD
jgi:hypothetical protein